MAAVPSKEALSAFRETLTTSYTALDEAGTHIDLACDDIETARDEARSLFGTSRAASIFNNALADIKLAARALADARNRLPELDEGDAEEE